ncbi:MAG: EamA family transporter [Muribaculaceae bacterium]
MSINSNSVVGYTAGVVTGVAYGLNPLFAMPLMSNGASVDSILFFRYFIAVALLGLYLAWRRASFRVTLQQGALLAVLGLLFAASSILLFESYRYIPSGLATTLIFLFPVMVALIMVLLGVYPTWQVWLSIAISFVGVIAMTGVGTGTAAHPVGVLLSIGSALSYAIFIVIVNRSRSIARVSNTVLTFYALAVGSIVFGLRIIASDSAPMVGISGTVAWVNLIGLALLPTIISTATLSVATRRIGAAKASVLGVFEPITAIIVGVAVLGEPLTLNIILGISLAIAAVLFMVISSRH